MCKNHVSKKEECKDRDKQKRFDNITFDQAADFKRKFKFPATVSVSSSDATVVAVAKACCDSRSNVFRPAAI